MIIGSQTLVALGPMRMPVLHVDVMVATNISTFRGPADLPAGTRKLSRGSLVLLEAVRDQEEASAPALWLYGERVLPEHGFVCERELWFPRLGGLPCDRSDVETGGNPSQTFFGTTAVGTEGVNAIALGR